MAWPRRSLLVVGSTTMLQGVFFAFTALLRAHARTGDVMKASLAMNAVNIAASAALIGGVGALPALGVEGAAAANVVARVWGCWSRAGSSGATPTCG